MAVFALFALFLLIFGGTEVHASHRTPAAAWCNTSIVRASLFTYESEDGDGSKQITKRLFEVAVIEVAFENPVFLIDPVAQRKHSAESLFWMSSDRVHSLTKDSVFLECENPTENNHEHISRTRYAVKMWSQINTLAPDFDSSGGLLLMHNHVVGMEPDLLYFIQRSGWEKNHGSDSNSLTWLFVTGSSAKQRSDFSRVLRGCSLIFAPFPVSSDLPLPHFATFRDKPLSSDGHLLTISLLKSDDRVQPTVRSVMLWRAPPPLSDQQAAELGFPTRFESSVSPLQETNCEEDVSFIESKSVFLEEGMTMLNAVLKPVMSTMMDPLLEQVNTMVSTNTGDEMPKSVTHNMLSGIPRLVSGDATNSLSRNLSNILSDSLTDSLTNKLSGDITNDFGPMLHQRIMETAAPRIQEHIKNILAKSVPEKLNENLAQEIYRSLPIILTAKLTRSITHALVPTLTLSLTHSLQQDEWCESCRADGKRCSACHYSTDTTYYTNYYGAYYAEYFSDYYADYYTNAITKVHDMQYAPEHPEGVNDAIKGNADDNGKR